MDRFREGPVGDRSHRGAYDDHFFQNIRIQLLVSGMFVGVPHLDLVAAVDFQGAVVRDGVAQTSGSRPDDQTHMSTDRKAFDDLDIAAGRFARDFDGLVGL